MAANDTPPEVLERERRGALRALPWVFVSFLGVTTGMTLTYLVMRAVMQIGGSCASGGPYVSARPCPDVTWLLPVGIVGGMIFGFVYILKKPARAPSFASLLWPALFLSLGWNFLDFGLKPPGRTGVDWGWLVCAVVFALMGAGPLILAVPAIGTRAYLRRMFWGDEGLPQPSEFKPSVQPREASPPRRPAPPPPPEPADDVVSALERLAGLRKSGALTAEEFEAAKRRVLGGRG